jgi:hypothetical protein
VNLWASGIGPVTIGVEDREDGIELIQALSADAKSITANFVLTEPDAIPRFIVAFAFAFATLVGAVMLNRLGMKPAGHICLVTGLVAMMAMILSQAVRVTVGADGIVVRKGLRSRFIPHDQVVKAERDGVDLVVRLKDGELRWQMVLSRKAKGSQLEVATRQADRIAKRIEEARTAYAELGGDPTAIPALARAGKSTRDWLDALRKIGKEVDAGFRGGIVGRERLWMLVESTQVPPAFRVSAAVALRVSSEDGEETSTRLREIAEACASPKLGDRLRIAAGAGEPELEELLDESELKESDRDARRMRRSDP